MKLSRLIIVAVMIGAQTVTGQSPAGTEADEIAKLKKQIAELAEKIRILEQKHELEVKEKETKSPTTAELDQKIKILERNRDLDKEAPKITVGEQGFSLGSADGNFSVQLKGVLQVDRGPSSRTATSKGTTAF